MLRGLKTIILGFVGKKSINCKLREGSTKLLQKVLRGASLARLANDERFRGQNALSAIGVGAGNLSAVSKFLQRGYAYD